MFYAHTCICASALRARCKHRFGGRFKFKAHQCHDSIAQVEVRFEPELAALFRPGMAVTGAWQTLSDGSCRLSEPSYVFPSWHCPGGCSRARSPAQPGVGL